MINFCTAVSRSATGRDRNEFAKSSRPVPGSGTIEFSVSISSILLKFIEKNKDITAINTIAKRIAILFI
jgi:hypothetical protein